MLVQLFDMLITHAAAAGGCWAAHLEADTVLILVGCCASAAVRRQQAATVASMQRSCRGSAFTGLFCRGSTF
jgi:hypothetical protein